MVRFGVRSADEATREMVTATGLTKVGTVFSTLRIDGRMLWRGEAIAVPASPESGADGLLPIALFRSIYVSNANGYLIWD